MNGNFKNGSELWKWGEFWMPQKNCFMFACEKKEKTSQYKGVYYDKTNGKWHVLISPKGQKRKYGGMFKDELDAAKRVNQLCEDFGIPRQNPELSAVPNHQYEVTEKFLQQSPSPPLPPQTPPPPSRAHLWDGREGRVGSTNGAPIGDRVSSHRDGRKDWKILDQNAHPWVGEFAVSHGIIK